MKLASLALLAMLVTLHAAPVPSQTVERWQAAAVLKYPALKQPGSPLNQQFLAVVAEKRKSDPAFFNQPDWPLRAADLAVAGLAAAETAAKEKAKADEPAAQEKDRAEAAAAKSMTREQREKADADREHAEELAQWESQKDKWVFDRLVFGDSEEVIIRKLNLSKMVSARVAPKARVELNSRYRWVIGERNFNMEFEMKDDKLAAITFGCLAEKTTELDTLVREDWDKLRAAAIERFGPPAKSPGYPAKSALHRGGLSVTDVWERPGSRIELGVAEEESKCNPALRISGAAAPKP
jgi:hypothetical protein